MSSNVDQMNWYGSGWDDGGGERCDSLIGRASVLSGDVVACLSSPLLYRWIDLRIQWLRQELQRLVKLKHRIGILDVQNRMISLHESRRASDDIVNGFWDEESSQVETHEAKRQRYLRSELCECSEPEYWQLLHHDGSSSKSTSEDDDSPPRDADGGLAPALRGYAEAREAALARAYESLHQAEARSDQEAIDRCNDAINMLTLI